MAAVGMAAESFVHRQSQPARDAGRTLTGGIHEILRTLGRWVVASDNQCPLPKAPHRLLQLIIQISGARIDLLCMWWVVYMTG